MMIIVWVICGVMLGVFLTYSVHSGIKYTRMIGEIFLNLVYRPAPEDALSSRGQLISILDSSDKEMEILFVESKNSNKVVIFCHESGSSKESWEKYAYLFPDLGFHVLSVDFRSREDEETTNSLSQWPTEDDVQKLLTVIRWSKRAIRQDIEIVLFGVSNGADISLAASFHDLSVKAVITDGLFSMKEIFRDYIRKWAPILVRPNLFGQHYPDWVVNIFTNLGFWHCQNLSGKKFVDVEKLLKFAHVPVLMIHGQDDDYIPTTHQKFLHRINRGEELAEKLVVPKAGHNEAVVLARHIYENKITNFLKKTLQ